MKLLLDACVWGKAREELRAAGHDVIHAGDWPEDPGDEEILRRADQERRVLVTLDKDFGALAVLAVSATAPSSLKPAGLKFDAEPARERAKNE